MRTYNMVGAEAVSRHADLRLELLVQDNNAPRDLTGWTFEFTILAGNQALLTATLANGKITVPSPTNGKLFIAIPKADFATLQDGTYDYYCSATLSGATELLIDEGKLELR